TRRRWAPAPRFRRPPAVLLSRALSRPEPVAFDPAPKAESSARFGGSAAVSCRLQEICADEPVQVAVEDALGVPHLEAGACVLHLLVRMEDVAADGVAAEPHGDAAALAGELGLALLLRLLGEARAEDLHRGLLVRRLAALVLH